MYAVCESGHVIGIPKSTSDLKTFADAKMCVNVFSGLTTIENAELRMCYYETCQFTKQLYIVGTDRSLYVYDLLRRRINAVIALPHSSQNTTIPPWPWMNGSPNERPLGMCVNWFGTELFIVCHSYLYVLRFPRRCNSLKEAARIAVLKNFSEEMLVELGLCRSILGFLFNEYQV